MSATDAPEQDKVVVTADEEHKDEHKHGKVSNTCCQHPEKKKKKKNPFAEGFSAALGGDEQEPKKELTEEEKEAEQRAIDEEESQMIPEDKLIEELGIDPTDEVINLIQLRIFNMEKVALHTLTNCKNLVLRQNLIHDVTPLPDNLLESLRELELYDNKIKKIQNFEAIPHLKVLDLSYNNIRIIENLNIPTLEVLFLTENKISKIQGLEHLTRLRQLELGSNRIRAIENLSHLTELEDLWLGKNKISKLEGLTTLTKLRRLSLQANRLTEIPSEALAKNTSLTDVHLSENGIKKIEHIAHLKEIRLIDFCFNPIVTIDEIDQLPKVEEFWITDARVADWKEVQKLEKLKTLTTIYLERNPVEDARYRHKLVTMMPWLKEIDSWPVVTRDQTGNKSDGQDPRGLWVDSDKAEITFKASRGDAPIMPTVAEVEAEKAAKEAKEAQPAPEVDSREDVD